jgi:hypothetical protein
MTTRVTAFSMTRFISALVLLALIGAASASNKAILLYQRVEGDRRICVYDTAQGRIELTLPAAQACPLEFDVPDP